MKTIFVYLSSILFFLFFLINAQAQEIKSCCAMPSTTEFAMLGKDPSFTASHLAPLPFHYISPKGKMITYKVAGGKDARAFEIKSAKPTTNYLFVIHEWWGLNDYIRQEAELLQNQLGDVNVIAVDLYDGRVTSDPDSAGKIMGEAKEDRIRAILKGAVIYAGTGAKIQTIGWCFGGGWSLQAAEIAGKQCKGCVMYYGMPEKDVQKIKSISFPVCGFFAAKDGWIKKDMVEQFEKDMKANGKEISVSFYDADHAFANPSNPKYDKTSADAAHKLAVEFLKKHL